MGGKTYGDAAATVVLLGCLALGIGACGGDDDPVAGPSSPTSSTASSSPPSGTASGASGSASSTPAATGKTLDAPAFVNAWVSARNATLAAGDFSGFDQLNSASCAYCKGFEKAVMKIIGPGGRIAGGRFLHPRSIEVKESTLFLERVDFYVDVEETKGYDADGKLTTTLAGNRKQRLFLRVEYDGKSWVTGEVGQYAE